MSLNASIPKTNVALSAASEANAAKVGGNNAAKMNAAVKVDSYVNANPKMNANAAPKLNVNAKPANAAKVNAALQTAGAKKASKSASKVAKRGGANVTTPPLNSSAVMNATKTPVVANAPAVAAPAAAAPAAVGGRSKKSASGKRGGALVDDLKNLAVPFAILLAKQGVENMYAKKNKSSKGSPKSASSPSSSRRRSTLAGGSACTTGCGMTGGFANASNATKVKQNFSKIAADIDAFLKKY